MFFAIHLFTPNTWYVSREMVVVVDGHGQTLNSYLCTYHCIYTVYTTAESRILVHAQKWDKVSVFEVPEDATEAERLERIPRIKDLFATPTDPISCLVF